MGTAATTSLPTRSARVFGPGNRLVWAMLLLLTVYLAGLALPSDDLRPVVNGWLGTITQWIPAALCWRAVYRSGFRRMLVLLAGAAVTVFAASNQYYVLALGDGEALSFPSSADFGYLLFYPLILGALAILVSRQLRALPRAVSLDSAVGALGAAALLAALLSPILLAAQAGGFSLATAVATAFPLLDLVLVAAVVGVASARGLDVGGRWGILVSGLLVFAATDVIYAEQIAGDSYAIGTLLDGGWAVGLTLIALWVDGLTRPPGAVGRRLTGVLSLIVPVVATAAGVLVLLLGTQVRLSLLAVALATATLAGASLRTAVAFRDLGRMADLRRQARTDDLTGLPNRRALYLDVPLRLASGGPRSALMLLDLDRFKEVNDSLGHDVGDELLVQVGRRLADQLRTRDLLARLGGDEFAILLDDAGPAEAEAVAATVQAALAEPFTLAGITLQTSVSVGIALYPEQSDNLTGLLRKADMAMYKAKAGGTGHHVYRSSDDSHGDARLRTVQELRLALHEDQLVLHYQPQIDLPTGQVNCVEALVRWQHPARGLLQPGQFLDLVEESGLMHAMTHVVLDKALDQAALWRAEGHPLAVAVNLSARSLLDAELPARVRAQLSSRGLPTSALTLEITEEFLLNDRERAREILTQLRETGIRIAVDDFGTGSSSLAYLRDLPIDELKLDRSFIMPMADDARAAALVSSIVDLAHSLGMSAVAEGVEDAVAYDELVRYGCDQAQGFHLSRPLPVADLDAWLLLRRAAVATA